MDRPKLRSLTGIFFRVGNTTFGGGVPTIAALQRELVDKRAWLSPEDYGLAFALSRLTPGTNIIAFCAGTGWVIVGFLGALAGTLVVTVPSALLALFIVTGFEAARSHPLVMGAIGGTVAAVAGMMWASAWSIMKPYTKGSYGVFRTLVISGGAFYALRFLDWSPLTIIGIATLVGFLWVDSSKPSGKKPPPAPAKEIAQ